MAVATETRTTSVVEQRRASTPARDTKTEAGSKKSGYTLTSAMAEDSFLERIRPAICAPAAITGVESPWANRWALVALAPLALGFAYVVVRAPWHSNFDIDTLTHYLQILSIADHGSAGYANGPVAGNPELTPRWLFPYSGQAWGPYPVLGDYLLAPLERLGGYRGVIRGIWLLFAESCLVTYALTYRLTRRPAVAVAAAYSLALATSAGFWGTMTAPFIPTAAFGITSIALVSRSFAASSRRSALTLAAAGGLLGTFAVGSHLLWTLAWAAVPVVCLVGGGLGGRLSRAAAYVLASAPGLFLMGAVNHARFGTWSPFSYGPCDTDGCLGGTTAADNTQNGGDFLAASAPYVPYVIVVALAFWLVRRSSRHVALLALVSALAALVPEGPGGTLFRHVGRTFWAYVFDLGNLEFGYLKWSEDPGTFSYMWRYGGPWCVRALFQCSPVLIAVLLPRERGAPEEKATYWVLVATCSGVLASILMRSNLPGPHAIGMAFLNQRYLVPALPALTVMAFVGVSELPLRAWHAIVAGVVGGAGAEILARQTSDSDLFRRQVTHWFPLGLAFALWACASGARLLVRSSRRAAAAHLAALLVAVAVGYGVAISFGVDRVAARVVRGYQDARAAELARCTPDRFVLVGGRAMDESLAILDEKHILFINPLMGPHDASNARRLVLESISPTSPAFLIDDEAHVDHWQLDWPGFAFERIPGCPRIRRIVPPQAP
jgi:hypothetical protein